MNVERRKRKKELGRILLRCKRAVIGLVAVSGTVEIIAEGLHTNLLAKDFTCFCACFLVSPINAQECLISHKPLQLNLSKPIILLDNAENGMLRKYKLF
jgi:hypothetical protein